MEKAKPNYNSATKKDLLHYWFIIFALVLIVIGLILPPDAQAQVTDLQPILLQASGAEPYEMEDIQVTAISPEGHLAGTYLSPRDINNRVVFVLLQQPDGQYKTFFLGTHPQATVGGFVNGKGLLVNATTYNGNKQVWHYAWQDHGYQAKQQNYGYANAAIAHTSNNHLAINVTHTGAPEQTTLPPNPYAQDIPKQYVLPQQCRRALLGQMGSANLKPVAFPMALPLNADAAIYGVAPNGHACGASKGFAGKDYLKSYYPFYATPDSVYLVLTGIRGRALAVNSLGMVAGVYQQANTGKEIGFIWQYQNRNNAHDGWQVIRNNRAAVPAALNEHGVVVGAEGNKAFVWHNQQYQYIDDLVAKAKPHMANWRFIKLTRINDHGLAVGLAVVNKSSRPVLLNLNKLGIMPVAAQKPGP